MASLGTPSLLKVDDAFLSSDIYQSFMQRTGFPDVFKSVLVAEALLLMIKYQE